MGKIFFLVISVIVFAGCSVPNSERSSDTNKDPTSQIPPINTETVYLESEALGVTPKQIQYPIWWVQPNAYSPKVIVFSEDKKVYYREFINYPLVEAGKWVSVGEKITVKINIPDLQLTINSDAGGVWDGSVSLMGVKLIVGVADFSEAKVLGLYSGRGNMIDTSTPPVSKTVMFAIEILPGGKMNFAGSLDRTMSPKQILGLASNHTADYSWKIGPLGDHLIVGYPPGTSTTLKSRMLGSSVEFFVDSTANLPIFSSPNLLIKNKGGGGQLVKK